MGESVPVNQKLSDIILQLLISEHSGRGVPKITDAYGREAFEFRENSIVVTISFDKIDDETVDKVIDKTKGGLSEVNIRIMKEMRYNHVTIQQHLAEKLGAGKTTIQKNIVSVQSEAVQNFIIFCVIGVQAVTYPVIALLQMVSIKKK